MSLVIVIPNVHAAAPRSDDVQLNVKPFFRRNESEIDASKKNFSFQTFLINIDI